jgi:hypothetical protein
MSSGDRKQGGCAICLSVDEPMVYKCSYLEQSLIFKKYSMNNRKECSIIEGQDTKRVLNLHYPIQDILCKGHALWAGWQGHSGLQGLFPWHQYSYLVLNTYPTAQHISHVTHAITACRVSKYMSVTPFFKYEYVFEIYVTFVNDYLQMENDMKTAFIYFLSLINYTIYSFSEQEYYLRYMRNDELYIMMNMSTVYSLCLWN